MWSNLFYFKDFSIWLCNFYISTSILKFREGEREKKTKSKIVICCYCWSCETISNWSNNQSCMCKLGLKVPMIKLHSFTVRGDLFDLFLFCVRHECVEIGIEPTTKSVKVKRLFNRACCSSVEVCTYIISVAIILRIYNLCYILLSFLSMTLPRCFPSPQVFSS